MWVFLQYLLGFRRLGYKVLYIDALESASSIDERGRPCSIDESWNVRYLAAVMNDFGLEHDWALVCNGGAKTVGLSRRQVLDRVKSAACLINVMGFLRDEEILACAHRLVFLDIDPGFGQMWRELGLADIFNGHQRYLTVGVNVGGRNSLVPRCGIDWITTPPPVVLDRWPMKPPCRGAPVTSVCTWRGVFGPVDYHGRTYGLRVHEFRKFMELPRVTGGRFQLAVDIDPKDARDLADLRGNGWELVDPLDVVSTPQAYQRYIQDSFAEFGVAKQMYVETRGGWISDRTVCYLASGRPALVQETGLCDVMPRRDGLVPFDTFEECVEGYRRICLDYERQCHAARAVAEDLFDSDVVLSRLLKLVGVG
jgi:hypothetical protein